MAEQLEDAFGVPLPDGDPASVDGVAGRLDDLGARLLLMARGVAQLLPVAGWSGIAASAADARLLDIAAALAAERSRVERAAVALRGCAGRLRAAEGLAAEARLLLAAAHREQAVADARDPSLAVARASGQWSGPRADGTVYDPVAVAVLRRAQDRARAGRDAADAATRRLVEELTELSGRRVLRESGSWRTLLDLAGFVPGYGDAVDLANAGAYAAKGDFGDAALTGAASVPGPLGWLAGGRKVERATEAVGDVARVSDDGTARARAVDALGSLTVPGLRGHVRMLPDDAAIDAFYRDVLSSLGPTTSTVLPAGVVSVTALPGGGRIVHRTFSRTGGHAVELQDVEGALVRLVHRSEG